MKLQKRPKKIQPKLRSRFPKRRDYDYLAWIRGLPCILWEHQGHKCKAVGDRRRIEPAHLKTQGSGGYDVGNCLPMCPALADESEGKMNHRLTEEKYGVCWQEKADELATRWQARQG